MLCGTRKSFGVGVVGIEYLLEVVGVGETKRRRENLDERPPLRLHLTVPSRHRQVH